MALSPGARLGPYEIVDALGAGGMGEVYRARDPRIGREVAIKVLPEGVAADEDHLRRFELEARALGALAHPAIVAVYDIGSADGAPYIVSELLDGETLRERLLSGPLPPRKALELAAQIARGLAAAHARSVVHRDLKPENLFVSRDGRARILDFGLAKLTAPAAATSPEARTEATLTTPGVVLGTAGYMAPEQVRGEAADPRADIFAFGAVLYEMLSGRRAFPGASALQTMNAILEDEPAPLAGASDGVGRLVQRCLEKSPEERFQSASDLAFALEMLAPASVSRPDPGDRPRLKKRTALWAAAGALAFVAAVALAWRARHAPPDAAPEPVFKRLTFRRGTIWGARFAPDGQTIVYGASWDGAPTEVFSMRAESPESRSLGLHGASLLAISSTAEMALLLNARGGTIRRGTLARAPLGGGGLRQLVEGVQAADWAAGGNLAVVRLGVDSARVEMPPGTLLQELRASPSVTGFRASSRGDELAIAALEEKRVIHLLRTGGGTRRIWSGENRPNGLAWSPDGEELWFALEDDLGDGIHAVTRAGRERVVRRIPGVIAIHDIAKDGRVLLELGTRRSGIMVAPPGESVERDLSWHWNSLISGLSSDGRTLLMQDGGSGGGTAREIYVRGTDGSPAIKLGEANWSALSPDGKWALLLNVITTEREMTLVPIGPGEARKITAPGPMHGAEWTPKSDGIVYTVGAEFPSRSYLQSLAGGPPRALTPEGIRGLLISPDGRWLAAKDAERRGFLWPLDGGTARPLADVGPDVLIRGWTADSKALVVFRLGDFPTIVEKLEIDSGRRTALWTLAPPGVAGLVEITNIWVTPDGSSHGYTYRSRLSELYLVEGLR